MPDFDNYVARHGEPWVQGIIEQIERREGIRHGDEPVDLEVRWNVLMNFTSTEQAVMA
jgi:hypothetical protein